MTPTAPSGGPSPPYTPRRRDTAPTTQQQATSRHARFATTPPRPALATRLPHPPPPSPRPSPSPPRRPAQFAPQFAPRIRIRFTVDRASPVASTPALPATSRPPRRRHASPTRLCVRFAGTSPSLLPSRVSRRIRLHARFAGAAPPPPSMPALRPVGLHAHPKSPPRPPCCHPDSHLCTRLTVTPAPVLALRVRFAGAAPLALRLVRARFATTRATPLVSPPPPSFASAPASLSHRRPRGLPRPVRRGPCCLPLRLVPMLRETGRHDPHAYARFDSWLL